jgi:hypothetical protein
LKKISGELNERHCFPKGKVHDQSSGVERQLLGQAGKPDAVADLSRVERLDIGLIRGAKVSQRHPILFNSVIRTRRSVWPTATDRRRKIVAMPPPSTAVTL